MPMERRDPGSGALIFVPTQSEKTTIQQSRELKQKLEEVDAMKLELQSLINQLKK
jgi:hypothetical protein